MFRLMLGETLRWVLALATLIGGAALTGTEAVVVDPAPIEAPQPQLEIALEAPEPMAIELSPGLVFDPPIETPETPEPTETATPTPTLSVTVVPTKPGISGIVFHPAHLNSGGKCREAYSAQGSLKNHGPISATMIAITSQVISGEEWVDHVEVTPAQWEMLGTSKPGRFQVTVYVNEEWASAGKGEQIQVQITATSDEGMTSEAVFVVRNQCQAEKGKPDKPDKPDKPGKPEKTPKPTKTPKPEKTPKPDKAPKPKNTPKPKKK